MNSILQFLALIYSSHTCDLGLFSIAMLASAGAIAILRVLISLLHIAPVASSTACFLADS